MIQTAEQIFESVKILPADERERFRELMETEKTNGHSTDTEQSQRNERFRKTLQWIEDHKAEYDGKFVLLEGGVLLGSGDDPKALYTFARSRGIKSPFVERIKAVELPFGGW